MRRWVAFCAVLVVCSSFVACKGGSLLSKSPGDVVKAFYVDANEGKYSDAKDLLSQDAQKFMEGDMGQLAGGFKKVCDDSTKNGTISRVDVVSQEIRGEGATVIANIFFKDGSKTSGDKTQLVKEKGEWKITIGS